MNGQSFCWWEGNEMVSERNETGSIGLSSYWLKWIAVITMVIDHTGAVLFPPQLIFRYIGRISFPIFCFLIVEGFCHTSNVKRYIIRLGCFAAISEIPFDIAFNEKLLEFESQNVFFTLLIGLVLLYVVQKSGNWVEKLLWLVIAMAAALFLKSDYSCYGVLLIFWFYIMREKKWRKLLGGAVWNFHGYYQVQGYGALSMLVIALYNGKRGPKMRYFFYLFYPLHLLLLWLIAQRIT